MRNQPWVSGRILLLPAETFVMARNILRLVFLAAFRTIPVHREDRLRDVFPPVVVIAFLLLMVYPLHRHTIVCPALDAHEVKERVARVTRPNLIRALHRLDADQAYRVA